MKIFKDKKIIALLIILVVFTIGYFIIVNKVSYAFQVNSNEKESYDALINVIKECSKKYGIDNPSIFNEEKIAYIKVQDLIDNNLLLTNEDGNIYNPLDKKIIMNSNVIKLKKDKEEIIVEIN